MNTASSHTTMAVNQTYYAVTTPSSIDSEEQGSVKTKSGYTCDFCQKWFERKDTLKRYTQIHSRPRPIVRHRQRACETCVRSKLKCKSERPVCSTCVRRGCYCVYKTSMDIPETSPASSEHHIAYFGDSTNMTDNTTNNSHPNGSWFEPSSFLGGDFQLNMDLLFQPDSFMLENMLVGIPPVLDSTYTEATLGQVSAVETRPSSPLPGTALPPLVMPMDVLLSNYYNVKSISSATRGALCNALSLSHKSGLWRDISFDSFPMEKELDHCIDMYFHHVDQQLPVIHRPTFDPSQDPLLTLSMIALGVCYTAFDGAHTFSNMLSELIRRALVVKAEQDPRAAINEDHITTQLLQCVSGFTSGSRRLFELSESSRASIVYNSRQTGLFRARPSPLQSEMPLEVRWSIWIKEERRRYLGWAIYGYDATASYIFNTRPYFSLAELDMDLQLSTKAWQAPTAYAWASLYTYTTTPTNPRLRPLLHAFLDDTDAAYIKTTDNHHILPVILTIVRSLWSIQEWSAIPMISYVPPPNQSEALLKSLDCFLIYPYQASKLDHPPPMIDLVLRLQIVHMAHLVAGGGFTGWLYPFLRGNHERAVAQSLMRRWAEADPGRVRDQAFHCAQIIGIIREYPFHLAQECFNIYHAGTLLFCLCDMLAEQGRFFNEPPEAAGHVRLDTLDYDTTRDTWIRDGSHTINLAMFGIPDLLSQEGRQQLLTMVADALLEMKVWAISKNLRKVVLRLRDDHH